ncbi:MAG: hypothetical protein COU63_03450 [Candidatus Pacebacteria bacterium CG10_big_fil_rev_8_21_14_0_10_36_11]|nr:hypothetical protein [Candidatus Pacearchaeota archaeon]OIP73919.1 MAG: hypothetical protein AUK08_05175 [Candidatus Pacebacteria bacterium CG2_30_36_39]PIR64520.1 MAG: hypothetical protein COU63_03450 [Candidatus Pacebacteria bacterium CG10_big_fil_rev_8_21_14_0_10_36_11]PJC42831.1 MAG: hypothetical protein CO040_02365 [Candidatus Pacebacteria bacterium CG_4_9_14_0_2_um_filter_36_8]
MKNNSALSFVQSSTAILLQALLVIAPLLVVPYTRNLIVDTKSLFLFLIALLVTLGFAIKTFSKKKWELAVSPLTLPLALFGGSVLISSFLSQKYPVESLLGMGGVYISLALIGIFGSSMVKGNYTEKVTKLLGISGGLLAISMVLEQFGYGPSRLINSISAFDLPHSLLFNLSGSSFVAAQVMLIALVGIVAGVLNKKNLTTTDLGLGIVNLLGLLLAGWSMLPGKIAAVTLTPFQASWTVVLRSLESLQSAIIGHGPASYVNMYTRFKPLWTNGQSYWQFNFGSASDVPLTLVVTVGLLGLISWLFLVGKVFLQTKLSSKESKPLLMMLLATYIIQLAVPANVVMVSIQAALFVFWVAANQNHFSLLQFRTWKVRSFPKKLEFIQRIFGKKNWFLNLTAILLAVASLGTTYLVGMSYIAQHYMYRANNALAKKDIVQLYENQRKAVATNRYLDTFRREYALTNLQIAIALSNNADITEEEKQQAIQLVSQAIRDGKAATLLDPADVDNWTTLAEIYRNLIGTSAEASNWAVSSLVSAVQVNPINPNLRLEIGRLALADKKSQDALTFFAQAAELKPDMAAAYYHLGLAFQQMNQPEDTKKAWQRALLLLENDSSDYITLSQQLAQLEEVIKSNPTGTQETTTAPEVPPAPTGTQQPGITQQNVQQQEADILNPGLDAPLDPAIVQ